MLYNGEDLIAEIPFEHLTMYGGYGRIGKIIKLGAQCKCCGKKARHFLLIKHLQRRFALYTEDYVELTIDHIIPKHCGGKDTMKNYQILCLFCNRVKGCSNITIEELRERIKSITRSI